MFEVLLLVGRVLLGAVLLVAAVAKFRDRTGFAASVRAFGFVPRSWSGRVAGVLPVVELVCGILLLTGIAMEVAAVAASGLLIILRSVSRPTSVVVGMLPAPVSVPPRRAGLGLPH